MRVLSESFRGSLILSTACLMITGICSLRLSAKNSKEFFSKEHHTEDELLAKLHHHRDWQNSQLTEFSVVRTYSVQDEKGLTVAEEVVLMQYGPPDTKTFTTKSWKGSAFVRGHVFRRLMAREAARTRNRQESDDLITRENYNLEIKGTEQVGSSECTVIHAVPKRKKPYLFEGDIWIDNQDFAIVKIKGKLAKSPSFWIKRVEFVREYKKVNGFFLLAREEAIADIKFYGRRTLTVACKSYAFGNATP